MTPDFLDFFAIANTAVLIRNQLSLLPAFSALDQMLTADPNTFEGCLIAKTTLGDLVAVRPEITHRQSRSISYRISSAKFPVLKDLDDFVFTKTTVDEGQVRELANGEFLDAKRNVILV